MISGEETDAATSIGNELGDVNDLSGTSFSFSIQHNRIGGRNFTFTITNSNTMETHTLCWGQNCEPGSNSADILNGAAPIFDYDGLAIQVPHPARSPPSMQVAGFSGCWPTKTISS